MQQYQLTRKISAGGMGNVYVGRKLTPLDTSDLRPVAVKVVPPRNLEEEERQAAALFCREAVLSWQISHEHRNLVTTYDYGISANEYRYLVMEMVHGASLRALTKGRDTLAYPIIRRIIIDVLSGLAYLHQRGVVHRDITARNILVSRLGEVKLADFGLIKALHTSASSCFRGTEQYAAPEQLQGDTLSALSDLYSVGVVLYLLLTGEFPYGETGNQVMRAAFENHAPGMLPEDVPFDLADVTYGLIALRPGERGWGEANDVLRSIAEAGQPVASAEELAQMVEERSQHDEKGETSATSVNHLPALGWPFAELEPASGPPSPASMATTPAEPATPTRSTLPRWLPWALVPLAFAAGLAVFWVAARLDSSQASSALPSASGAPAPPTASGAPTPVAEEPSASIQPAVGAHSPTSATEPAPRRQAPESTHAPAETSVRGPEPQTTPSSPQARSTAKKRGGRTHRAVAPY